MKTIVLDVLIPCRHEKDLKGKHDEKKALLAGLKELKEDKRARGAWRRLMEDYDAEELVLQARRQNPKHPFKHKKPHREKVLKTDGAEHPANPKDEPEQSSGKSGLLVATLHFPKKDGKTKPEKDIANDTNDFLDRLENIIGRQLKEHSRAYGYKTINARGQQYDDLESVRHNSFDLAVTVVCLYYILKDL